MSQSKRLKAAAEKIDRTKVYSIDEALVLVRETSQVKFDASVEVHAKLGIDTKQGDQLVRATVVLPHGNGKKIRLVAFVPEDQVQAAKKAGADIAGNTDLINEIKTTGKCDFDLAVATPDMMKELAAVARILGQKGLMPNPKTGTISPKITQIIQELKAGKVAFKNDNFGNIHVVIGRISFEDNKLKENFQALMEVLKKSKPEKIKGTFIRSLYLTSSMGPSVKVAAS